MVQKQFIEKHFSVVFMQKAFNVIKIVWKELEFKNEKKFLLKKFDYEITYLIKKNYEICEILGGF